MGMLRAACLCEDIPSVCLPSDVLPPPQTKAVRLRLPLGAALEALVGGELVMSSVFMIPPAVCMMSLTCVRLAPPLGESFEQPLGLI